MKGLRRRILSILIAFTVIISMNVMPVFAAEADDNDALFEKYVESQLYSGIEGYSGSEVKLRSVYLSDINQRIYSKLKSQIAEVAAGNITSTEFTVSVDDLGLAGMKWTAADLGVSQLYQDGQISSEAITALMDQLGIDLDRVLDALLAETPYEYYWYDKTAGVAIAGPGYRLSSSSAGQTLSISEGYTFSFSVAKSYAAGTYEVDNSNITRVNDAVEKAHEIVSEAAAFSDEEKLVYYMNQICDLVSYDDAAAGGTTPYGNQWQLISVFDGDDTTNVVCEGYSKAFKYLCDLSEFDDPKLECILVSGIMRGATGAGNHMWNIVSINGVNFLADVTNCDEGTIGAPDQLFLAGTENGDVESGYTFTCESGNIYYAYDAETKGLYDQELTLYPENYDGSLAYIPKAVESIDFQAVPRLRKDVDASLSATAFSGDTVTLHYNDGTSEKYTFDTTDWTFKNADGVTTEESNRIAISYDGENHVDFAAYNNDDIHLRAEDPGASFVAKSIDIEQAEPVKLVKGVNSSTAIDEQGNEYEKYFLSRNDWFKADDKFFVTYENGLGESINVEYVYDDSTGGFTLAEGTDYYTGYPSDNYFGNSFEVDFPDQSVEHFEAGNTYGMRITYHESGSNFDLTPLVSSDTAYQVLIKEAGPEDVTSVSFINSSPGKIEKGNTLQLYVKWEPAYVAVPAAEITWTSDDPDVAIVDDNGLVTAVSEGSAQISAQIGDCKAVKDISVWEKKIFTDESVSLSKTVFAFTGSNVSISGKVMYNGELINAGNYSMEYWDSSLDHMARPLGIGKYKVIISGREEAGYYGSVTKEFWIKGNLAETAYIVTTVTLDSTEEYVYSGEPVEPEVMSVVFDGKTLTEGKDYTVSYEDNVAVGTGYVIITAVEDSDYMGEKRIPFTIVDSGKSGWIKEDGYWYFYENNKRVTSTWQKDSKGWCWLQEDGKMLTNGWAKDSKGWCWIGDNGYMVEQTKWIKVDGSWYHITNGYRDQGKWMKDSKGWCWLQSDGRILTNGWAKDSKGWCWIASNGYMPTTTQWIQYDGGWYHITKGYRDENKWMKDSKGWCWLQSDGRMLTNGWAKDSKGWCWIASNGYMPTTTQWVKYDGGWYHITNGYRDQNKWMKDSKGWCWLQSDGRMLTNGWAKDSKGNCWIASDGYMPEETMWVEYEGEQYYIEKGYRAENKTIEIDGQSYEFDAEGHWTIA